MKHYYLFALLLAGCSTYSKKQCQEMDWYKEGMKAAMSGYNLKQAKTPFIDKCQEDHGVSMDLVDFERGFANGVNKVCTPEGIKQLMEKGIRHQETCESKQDTVDSKKIKKSELEERIEDLEAEVSRLKSENAKLKATPPKVGPPEPID